MREIRSYVVRFYRRDADGVAGVLEDVQRRRTASFRSHAELCALLDGRKPFGPPAPPPPATPQEPLP